MATISNPRFDLAGKVVIITGGGSGLGKVYSQAFARAGARVLAADLAVDGAMKVTEDLRGEGYEALGMKADISEPADNEAMARAAIDKWGRIDVLINNASMMSVLERRSWLEIPVEEWDRVMAVNLRGMFLGCRAVHPAMKAQKYGKIVNIASGRFFDGTPNRLHYSTSKAGVVGLTRSLSREVAADGITVNAVAPGMTLSETQIATSSSNYAATRLSGRAIERAQVPEDLVGAVMFLSTAASDFMTGQTINVDGGKNMH